MEKEQDRFANLIKGLVIIQKYSNSNDFSFETDTRCLKIVTPLGVSDEDVSELRYLGFTHYVNGLTEEFIY